MEDCTAQNYKEHFRDLIQSISPSTIGNLQQTGQLQTWKLLHEKYNLPKELVALVQQEIDKPAASSSQTGLLAPADVGNSIHRKPLENLARLFTHHCIVLITGLAKNEDRISETTLEALAMRQLPYERALVFSLVVLASANGQELLNVLITFISSRIKLLISSKYNYDINNRAELIALCHLISLVFKVKQDVYGVRTLAIDILCFYRGPRQLDVVLAILALHSSFSAILSSKHNQNQEPGTLQDLQTSPLLYTIQLLILSILSDHGSSEQLLRHTKAIVNWRDHTLPTPADTATRLLTIIQQETVSDSITQEIAKALLILVARELVSPKFLFDALFQNLANPDMQRCWASTVTCIGAICDGISCLRTDRFLNELEDVSRKLSGYLQTWDTITNYTIATCDTLLALEHPNEVISWYNRLPSQERLKLPSFIYRKIKLLL